MKLNEKLLDGQTRVNSSVEALRRDLEAVKLSLSQQVTEVGVYNERLEAVDRSIANTKQLINTTIDITRLPGSAGALRDIQDISFDMLREIDRICKKHKLEYWLDFGTLLGAARHKGFIPWDDDMDISMMNGDYEKLLDVIEDELKDTDFRFIRVPSQIGKVVHKNFMPQGEDEVTQFIHWTLQGKLVFALDIFPYYYAKDSLADNKLKDILIESCSDKTNIFSGKHTYSDFIKADKEVKKYIKQIKSSKLTNRLFLGPETRVYQPRIVNKEDVFPLIWLEFEGREFPVPHHYEPYLIDCYGDFMRLPDQTHTHLFLDTIPKNELKLLKRIRQKDDNG